MSRQAELDGARPDHCTSGRPIEAEPALESSDGLPSGAVERSNSNGSPRPWTSPASSSSCSPSASSGADSPSSRSATSSTRAVAMMICFGSLAGMYALLGAPIVAAAQVLIYLGAISVLILFAIMLTQAGDANLPAPFHRQLPIAAVVALIVTGLVGWAVVQTDWGLATEAVAASVDAIATAIFTDLRAAVRDHRHAPARGDHRSHLPGTTARKRTSGRTDRWASRGTCSSPRCCSGSARSASWRGATRSSCSSASSSCSTR